MKPGTLFLVGTPIGNVGDMSERARETLESVDLVAAEDTRHTGRLLQRFGIRTSLLSMFEGNEERRSAELVTRLLGGADVAVVSDAGMPGLSDPGYRLVRACVEAGVEVRVIPGPSAVVAALVVSGLPTDRFAFEGFLPRKAAERRARLASLQADPRTLVVFESSRRVAGLLRDIGAVMGDRRIAVVREITKLHEEVVRGRTSEVLERLAERPARGEVVVVLEGNREPQGPALEALVAEASELVERGMRKRAAAGEVARRRGASANELYRALLERGAGRP